MNTNKIKIIKIKDTNKKCYTCKQKSYFKKRQPICSTCDNTGIFKDNHYILITNGIAFSMDTIK